MPTNTSPDLSTTPKTELEAALPAMTRQPLNSPATDAAGRDTTSLIALCQRCTWPRQGMENRAESGVLEEVPRHHAAQGGIRDMGARCKQVWACGDKSKRGHMAAL